MVPFQADLTCLKRENNSKHKGSAHMIVFSAISCIQPGRITIGKLRRFPPLAMAAVN